MNTISDKLVLAEAAIEKNDWLEYVSVPYRLVLHIDTRLISRIGQFLRCDFDVGAELAAHYRIAIREHGEAYQNPAQLELFLTFKKNPPITVFLCTVNGKVYFSSEQLCPF